MLGNVGLGPRYDTDSVLAGGAVTDFDGDGMLDLILSHGESMAQPISIFKGTQVSQAGGPCVIPVLSTSPSSVSLLPPPLQGTSNNWLRVIPRTRFGAFARGAKVVLFTRRSGAHLRIIDGGSGYLCEMEPVAHFGLGELGGQGAASTPSLPRHPPGQGPPLLPQHPAAW